MATALTDFTKDELLELGPDFAVDVKPSMSKAALVKAFEDDGVTVEVINSVRNQADDEEGDTSEESVPEAEAPGADDEDDADLVLVRMIRANNTYEIRGYRFTQEHPYVLVNERDADFLIERDGGFRVASPKEAREFYS